MKEGKSENSEKLERISKILKTENNMQKIEERLKELKSDFLVCPSCNKKVTLSNGKLQEGNGFFLEKSTIEKIKKEVLKITNFNTSFEKEVQNLKTFQSLFDEMKLPEKVEKIEGNKLEIRKKIDLLKAINFIDFDTDLYNKLNERFQRSVLTEKKILLEEAIQNNYQKEFECVKPPDNFSSYFTKYQSLKEKLKLVDEKLSDLNKLKEEEIKVKLKKLEDIFDNFEKLKKLNDIEEEESKLDKMKNELSTKIAKKENCLKIKKIIEDVSSKTFENLIIHFNQILNQVLQSIFENIQIDITMFKKIKGKNILKPQFNMNVILKGNEYDNLNFLSGGEKDRLSIALLVTLSSLTKFPILMLDESMSSLDENLRNETLELIKKYLPDKTILNVCHFTVEGSYDSIIKF